MRKILALVCLAGLVVAGQVVAQEPCNEDPDEVCILFAEDCSDCQNCLAPGAAGPIPAYFVLMNCSEPSGVSGFEFCLVNSDGEPLLSPSPTGIFVTGYSYPPGAINAATEPCFAVGLASPISFSPCMTLLTMNLLIVDQATEWCFGFNPAVPASIPDNMVFAAGDDPGNLKPMIACVGPNGNRNMVACLNVVDCVPLDSENATWGTVKSLFR